MHACSSAHCGSQSPLPHLEDRHAGTASVSQFHPSPYHAPKKILKTSPRHRRPPRPLSLPLRADLQPAISLVRDLIAASTPTPATLAVVVAAIPSTATAGTVVVAGATGVEAATGVVEATTPMGTTTTTTPTAATSVAPNFSHRRQTGRVSTLHGARPGALDGVRPGPAHLAPASTLSLLIRHTTHTRN